MRPNNWIKSHIVLTWVSCGCLWSFWFTAMWARISHIFAFVYLNVWWASSTPSSDPWSISLYSRIVINALVLLDVGQSKSETSSTTQEERKRVYRIHTKAQKYKTQKNPHHLPTFQLQRSRYPPASYYLTQVLLCIDLLYPLLLWLLPCTNIPTKPLLRVIRSALWKAYVVFFTRCGVFCGDLHHKFKSP